MATLQYVGARYVPKLYADRDGSNNWEAGVYYEPLTIVTYGNASYTSKQQVPPNIGNPPSSPEYWVMTGNYNGAISEVLSQISQLTTDMNTNIAAVNEAVRKSNGFRGMRILLIGDSYAQDNTNTGATGLASLLKTTVTALGGSVDSVISGGYGFGDGTQYKFLDLLKRAQIKNYTHVIFVGGYNDAHSTDSSIITAMEAVKQYCLINFPDARLAYFNFGMQMYNADFYKLLRAHAIYLQQNTIPGFFYDINSFATLLSDSAIGDDNFHPTQYGISLELDNVMRWLCGSSLITKTKTIINTTIGEQINFDITYRFTKQLNIPSPFNPENYIDWHTMEIGVKAAYQQPAFDQEYDSWVSYTADGAIKYAPVRVIFGENGKIMLNFLSSEANRLVNFGILLAHPYIVKLII